MDHEPPKPPAHVKLDPKIQERLNRLESKLKNAPKGKIVERYGCVDSMILVGTWQEGKQGRVGQASYKTYESGKSAFTLYTHPTLRPTADEFKSFSNLTEGSSLGDIKKCLSEISTIPANYLIESGSVKVLKGKKVLIVIGSGKMKEMVLYVSLDGKRLYELVFEAPADTFDKETYDKSFGTITWN